MYMLIECVDGYTSAFQSYPRVLRISDISYQSEDVAMVITQDSTSFARPMSIEEYRKLTHSIFDTAQVKGFVDLTTSLGGFFVVPRAPDDANDVFGHMEYDRNLRAYRSALDQVRAQQDRK